MIYEVEKERLIQEILELQTGTMINRDDLKKLELAGLKVMRDSWVRARDVPSGKKWVTCEDCKGNCIQPDGTTCACARYSKYPGHMMVALSKEERRDKALEFFKSIPDPPTTLLAASSLTKYARTPEDPPKCPRCGSSDFLDTSQSLDCNNCGHSW